jgi:hypothetical protein
MRRPKSNGWGVEVSFRVWIGPLVARTVDSSRQGQSVCCGAVVASGNPTGSTGALRQLGPEHGFGARIGPPKIKLKSCPIVRAETECRPAVTWSPQLARADADVPIYAPTRSAACHRNRSWTRSDREIMKSLGMSRDPAFDEFENRFESDWTESQTITPHQITRKKKLETFRRARAVTRAIQRLATGRRGSCLLTDVRRSRCGPTLSP